MITANKDRSEPDKASILLLSILFVYTNNIERIRGKRNIKSNNNKILIK
jgi:hypothetical protein